MNIESLRRRVQRLAESNPQATVIIATINGRGIIHMSNNGEEEVFATWKSAADYLERLKASLRGELTIIWDDIPLRVENKELFKKWESFLDQYGHDEECYN